MHQKSSVGITLVLVALTLCSASAIVYETAQQTVGQTIVNAAKLTLQYPNLGTIEEGETKSYTKVDEPKLGEAITVDTTKKETRLNLYSDIDKLGVYYSTYSLAVKFIKTPEGSSHKVGDIAATLTIDTPSPTAIPLDVAGTWVFDFELTTTAKPVDSDQTTAATITVSLDSAK
jgi:hypothetical protein